jgi:hypothetical protein
VLKIKVASMVGRPVCQKVSHVPDQPSAMAMSSKSGSRSVRNDGMSVRLIMPLAAEILREPGAVRSLRKIFRSSPRSVKQKPA